MRVISLRENAGWSWRQIGRELWIDSQTASSIYHRYNQYSIPSKRKRTGRPPIFDDEEKVRLFAFITRDSRTRRLSWEAICIEMDYACDPKTVRNVMISQRCTKSEVQRKAGQQTETGCLVSSQTALD